MENSALKARVLVNMERLIGQTVAKGKITEKIKAFHTGIIKKHYNATDVVIDYHRQRVQMNIVVDDGAYNAKKVNTNLELLPANLLFKNLGRFLKSCLEQDPKSLAFYVTLVNDFSKANALVAQAELKNA